MPKLAIIASHPIQYYAPWFRHLAQEPDLDLRVFYLWDVGAQQTIDPGFRQSIEWDIPLLDGYAYEFVPNTSDRPNTNHFWGLQNPTLAQQVAAYQPDAVFCTLYNYASLYRFIFTWRQCPLLFRGDSHRLVPAKGVKDWARQVWISTIYRRFSACLYVGQANKHYFQYHDVPSARLFFAPHSVDNGRFMGISAIATQEAQRWKQSLGISADHRVILFAGKFIAKKRPLDLLQAFIQAKLPNVSLLFVGAGELEVDLKAQAASQPNVYFAPFQNQSLMPRTLAIADLLVLPSYGSGETWGLIVNEAMCLGKPIVVSHHVGCGADLVHPERNGFIFSAGDVQQLSKVLHQAFMESDLTQMGRESLAIIEHHSYTQMTKGLKAALESVRGNSGRMAIPGNLQNDLLRDSSNPSTS